MSSFLCKCGNIFTAGVWRGTARTMCNRCGRQWECVDDGKEWVEAVASWEERCWEADRWIALKEADRKEQQRIAMECERERDEARAELARLRHDPKADARQVIEEWRAKAERAWSDAAQAQERLQQATAMLREIRWDLGDVDGLPQDEYNCLLRRIDAFIAGQPAPAKPVVDDAMVSVAQERFMLRMESTRGNLTDSMRAALVAALEGLT